MHITDGYNQIEQRLFYQASQKKMPIYGNLELLPLCNLNCDMCFVRLSREELESNGRLRRIEEWKRLIDEMHDAGVLFLQLTGGEPLLYPDLKELYSYLRSKGFIITINSNGTLMDENWADFFAADPPRRINITLYGASNETYERLCHYKGGFDKVLSHVRQLRERNLDVKLNCSITKANADEWSAMQSIADEMGLLLDVETYMYPATRERKLPYNRQARLEPERAAAVMMDVLKHQLGEKEFANYSKQQLDAIAKTPEVERHPCGLTCLAGSCGFIVTWQGNLVPCILGIGPSVPVFETGFVEAWKKISGESQEIKFSPECSDCKLRAVCTNNCAASALYESGDMMKKPEYVCRYTESATELFKEYMEKTDS